MKQLCSLLLWLQGDLILQNSKMLIQYHKCNKLKTFSARQKELSTCSSDSQSLLEVWQNSRHKTVLVSCMKGYFEQFIYHKYLAQNNEIEYCTEKFFN